MFLLTSGCFQLLLPGSAMHLAKTLSHIRLRVSCETGLMTSDVAGHEATKAGIWHIIDWSLCRISFAQQQAPALDVDAWPTVLYCTSSERASTTACKRLRSNWKESTRNAPKIPSSESTRTKQTQRPEVHPLSFSKAHSVVVPIEPASLEDASNGSANS